MGIHNNKTTPTLSKRDWEQFQFYKPHPTGTGLYTIQVLPTGVTNKPPKSPHYKAACPGCVTCNCLNVN